MGRKRRKRRKRMFEHEYYRDWFTFPLSIELHSGVMEFAQPARALMVHFLWWHFRWIFLKDREDGKWRFFAH